MTVLADIVAATRRKVEEARLHADLRELERKAALHMPRGFRNAIEQASQSGPAIVAELKKASPSRGLIRRDFDPRLLAQELEIAGATALSVLTNGEFFQGSLTNLQVASAATRLPCLQKDFIVDELQVLEARANLADAILKNVAPQNLENALKSSRFVSQALVVGDRRPYITALITLAPDEVIASDLAGIPELLDAGRCGMLVPPGDLHALANGMESLLTNESLRVQYARAARLHSRLIGINNRDLQTFKVNLDTAYRLAQLLPPGVVTVAESGIETGADISQLRAAGYNGFLIGETLMRAPRPGDALRSLLDDAVSTAASGA